MLVSLAIQLTCQAVVCSASFLGSAIPVEGGGACLRGAPWADGELLLLGGEGAIWSVAVEDKAYPVAASWVGGSGVLLLVCVIDGDHSIHGWSVGQRRAVSLEPALARLEKELPYWGEEGCGWGLWRTGDNLYLWRGVQAWEITMRGDVLGCSAVDRWCQTGDAIGTSKVAGSGLGVREVSRRELPMAESLSIEELPAGSRGSRVVWARRVAQLGEEGSRSIEVMGKFAQLTGVKAVQCGSVGGPDQEDEVAVPVGLSRQAAYSPPLGGLSFAGIVDEQQVWFGRWIGVLIEGDGTGLSALSPRQTGAVRAACVDSGDRLWVITRGQIAVLFPGGRGHAVVPVSVPRGYKSIGQDMETGGVIVAYSAEPRGSCGGALRFVRLSLERGCILVSASINVVPEDDVMRVAYGGGVVGVVYTSGKVGLISSEGEAWWGGADARDIAVDAEGFCHVLTGGGRELLTLRVE